MFTIDKDVPIPVDISDSIHKTILNMVDGDSFAFDKKIERTVTNVAKQSEIVYRICCDDASCRLWVIEKKESIIENAILRILKRDGPLSIGIIENKINKNRYGRHAVSECVERMLERGDIYKIQGPRTFKYQVTQ